MKTIAAIVLALIALNLVSFASDADPMGVLGHAAFERIVSSLGAQVVPCNSPLLGADPKWLCAFVAPGLERAQKLISGVKSPGLRQTDDWDDDGSAHFSLGGASLYSANLAERPDKTQLFVWHEITH